MAKAPAFQWYPGDCDTDENVRGMDDAEFGFYVRCLNHSWLNNGLPTDIAEFARIMGKTPKQFLKLWCRVSRCFSENSEKRFINFRQEQQRSEQESFRKSRVEAAKSMHANKASLHVQPKTDAQDMHVHCSSSSSSSSSSIQHHLASADAKPVRRKKSAEEIGTRFQLSELPDEWAMFALTDCGMDRIWAARVFAEFRDYWGALPGAKGRKTDWFATWRNRCRDVKARDSPRGLFNQPRNPPLHDPSNTQYIPADD